MIVSESLDNVLIIIIDDHSRVTLQEIPNVSGSDFINACYIDVSIYVYMYDTGTSKRSNLVSFIVTVWLYSS